MKTKKDLAIQISSYLRNSKRKTIKFNDYCELHHINKLADKMALKSAILTSNLLTFSYSSKNKITEMIIMLK